MRDPIDKFQVFVSHGSHDIWLAGQIAKEIQAIGAAAFLDESHIAKGARDIRKIIREQIWASRELVALFTPWAAMRSWVWIEMGAAWNLEIPIIAVFYGMDINDLDRTGQGKSILESINVIQLNDIDMYLKQLAHRVGEARQ